MTPAEQVAAVRALHTVEHRYQYNPDNEGSWDTPEEAAEAGGHDDLDYVTHFDICHHCGALESRDDYPWVYHESLWPCATIRALGGTE